VYVNGTFTMHDGTISENTVSGSGNGDGEGGGVFIGGGTFTMHGGTISGNTARSATEISSSAYGGGVYVISGTFRKLPFGSGQNSGTINNNTAINGGYNVFYYSYSTLDGVTPKRRDTAITGTDQIDTSTGRGLSASGNPPFGN
jgi:hypothetical protein